jgi:transcription termination/antitermination protein NusG
MTAFNAPPVVDKEQLIPLLDFTADSAARWYAVRTRLRFEATTSAWFREKGFTTFLPTYLSPQSSDGARQLSLPLFPGYVFCRFPVSDQCCVLRSPGVVHIVGGDTPIPVPDSEIDAISRICDPSFSAAPWPGPAAGQRVTIERGPLQGIEGTLVRMNDKCRLVVSVSLLRKSVSTELDLDSVAGVS